MKKTIPKLLTLVCLLVAVMGLSIVTAHAATVTGIVSSLGIVFFIAFLSPNAKGRQHTLSAFWSGIQLVYPYSTTTMYSSDAAS